MTHEQTDYDSRMRACWERCEAFNAANPIGTKVRYRPVLDRPEAKLTETRSMAWTLPSAQAVVMVEGMSGGVSLDHVEVVSES